MQTAIDRVHAVRPEARLEGCELTTWTAMPPSRVEDEDLLSFPFARSVIAAHSQVLAEIGIFLPGEAEQLGNRIAGDGAEWATAFVVPSQALVVVREGSSSNLHVLMHEVGHLASHSAGYWKAAEAGLALRSDRPRDPAWIDLDAFLSTWAIEEGIAEVTALAAEQHAQKGSTSLAPLAVGSDFGRRLLERPTLVGPGHIVLGSRAFDLKAGEEVVVAPTLEELLLDFAYQGGQGYVLAHESVTPLEAHFAATWRDYRHTTREILQPRDERAPSGLARACRERWSTLDPQPAGATRVGALLAFHVATAHGEEPAAALELACTLQDDIALRWADGSGLWIGRFGSEAVATEFAARLRLRTSATVSVLAGDVQVVAGAVPARLLEGVAAW
ncbi:MAG: hypothetical protein EXS08_08630 [Planctomycetes bacterium]|nr:hypothetical protein [Planctomycetota bacterium]